MRQPLTMTKLPTGCGRSVNISVISVAMLVKSKSWNVMIYQVSGSQRRHTFSLELIVIKVGDCGFHKALVSALFILLTLPYFNILNDEIICIYFLNIINIPSRICVIYNILLILFAWYASKSPVLRG